MKKLAFVIAAISAIAAPSVASAETVVVKRHGHHHWDHGWHHDWHHHDRTVVIKHRD